MSLPAVDENWYCEDCDLNFEYCDKPDFLFCPNCGKVLKNDMYQYNLDGLIDSLNNLGKSICENCGEEFDKEYNFCPLCSEKLKKETIPFDIEKDNSVTVDWNGEKALVYDKCVYLSNPHFAVGSIIECISSKNYTDEKLECDFKRIDETLPEKLTYDEAYSIYELNGWGNLVHIEEFISKLSQDILESDQFKPNEKINYIENERFNRILKLREDLYVKLIRPMKKFKPIRGKIGDFFKLLKQRLNMKPIHKYTPKSVKKTVYLNVFLGSLIISRGFYSKTPIQQLSEN